MKPMPKLACRVLAALVLSALLVNCVPCGLAATDAGTLQLKGLFDSPASTIQRAWQFPYEDALFDKPANQYVHKLAQASLGMALSAFRTKGAALEKQDEPVREYLTQAGFGAISSEQFDMEPTKDTIATLIASKRINGATVIAVAVCGGGYKDEWLSNFNVGNGARHAGFDSAAQKVDARINAYIDAQGIEKPMKLWISGYSRAAAVSNLVAADMTGSGLFEGVYAYTFATPRNTRETGEYDNIFNIVGKFDPVPMIPFPEWGFKRYGIDMYTPAQETDSDYRKKKAAANEVSEKLTGLPFWNNVGFNHTLRTIIDYLLGILTSSEIYTSKMEPIMDSVWRDRSLPNLSGSMVKLMDDAELITEEQKHEVEYLLDYLSMTTYNTVTGQTGWNAKTTMLENLAHEHSPDVYVAWLFSSDDPAAIYTDSLEYHRLTYQGNIRISLIDNGGHFFLTVDENGNTSDWTDIPEFTETAQPLEERPLIAVQRQGTQTILTLPRDGIYVLLLEALKTEMLNYFSTGYTVGETHARMDDMCFTDMVEGELYSAISMTREIDPDGKLFYGDDDLAINPWSEELPYSPSVIMVMENRNVFHLTWTQMLWLIGTIAVLLIATITTVTILLVKRNRRKKNQTQTKEEETHAANLESTSQE